MKVTKLAVTLAATIALVLPFTVSADNHDEEERKPLTDVWFMVPKQGKEAEFEAALKEHLAYRAETGETRSWMGYRVALGQNVAPVMLRHCCFDWADRDQWVDAEGSDERGAHFAENVHPLVDHYHHYMERTDYENSHWPTDGSASGPYFGVNTWKLKMNTGPGPNKARAEISQAAIEAGWGDAGNHWLWITRIGGEPTLMLVNSFENYADMAAPEPTFYEFMAETMGSEKLDALFKEFGSAFASSDYTIWYYDEELSTPGDDD
jgi:hypothetical protein